MVKNFLYKAINFIFFIAFSWIFINVLINNNDNLGFLNFNPLIIIPLTIICLIVLLFINRTLEKRCNNISKKQKTVVLFCVIAVMAVLQTVLAYNLRVTPTWDFGFIHRNAASLVLGKGVENMDYFLYFRNNTGGFLVLSVVYKLASFLGVTRFVAVGIILNIVMIDIAIMLMFYCCDKIFGTAKAFLALLIAVITTPFYTYAPIYYTDTLSMFLPMLILYLFLRSRDVDTSWKKYGIYGAIGMVGAFGAQIKLTVAFMLIAISVELFLKGNFKEYIPKIVTMVVAFFIATQLFYVAVDSYGMFDFKAKEKSPVPFTHWIMMGMKGHGGWDYDDYMLTYSYPTRENRIRANLGEIRNRLNNYGIKGYFNFLTIKATWTWGDGTYYSPDKLRREPINNGGYQDVFLQQGKYFKYYAYFSQVIYISMFVLILLSSFSSITAKNNDYINILRIVMFGLMIFLLMWETRSRYIVNYIPAFILISLEGLNLLNSFIKGKGLSQRNHQ